MGIVKKPFDFDRINALLKTWKEDVINFIDSALMEQKK
jgi:hypothetical protein